MEEVRVGIIIEIVIEGIEVEAGIEVGVEAEIIIIIE